MPAIRLIIFYGRRNTPMDWPEFFLTCSKKGNDHGGGFKRGCEPKPFIDQYGAERWIHIPQPELRERCNELPKDKDLCLFCGTGARSFECQIILNQNGFTVLKIFRVDMPSSGSRIRISFPREGSR